jgi:hypothetical protein
MSVLYFLFQIYKIKNKKEPTKIYFLKCNIKFLVYLEKYTTIL